MISRFKFILALSLIMVAAAGAEARPLRILALGSSLTQGYGLPPGTEFTTQLQAALNAEGVDATVENAGVSGDTSAGGLRGWTGLWPITRTPPYLKLGSNDMLRGIPPEVTEKNLRAILARLQKDHVAVLLTGMAAQRNLGADYVKQFDGIYPPPGQGLQCRLLSFLFGWRGAEPKTQPGRRHASQSGGREDHRGAHDALREKDAGPGNE